MIGKDKTRHETVLFQRLKAELQQAFNAPEAVLSADDIIARNQNIV